MRPMHESELHMRRVAVREWIIKKVCSNCTTVSFCVILAISGYSGLRFFFKIIDSLFEDRFFG